MPNPFSWDYLNTVPPSNDVVDGWSILMLIVFGGGFLIASLAFYRPGMPPFRGRFRRKAVQFAAGVALWIFGAGLFFFLIQLLQIDPFTFGRRIWMFLVLLVTIGYVVVIGVRWVQRSAAAKPPMITGSGTAIQRPLPHRRPVRRRRI
jgi:hypothetical protein